MKFSLTQKTFAIVILGVTIFTCIAFFLNFDLYEYLVGEDHLYENGTAIFLFATSITLSIRFFTLFSTKKNIWRLGVALMTLAFFFGGGEEISWGQRIFDIESSQYFQQNNAQQETNLHNMQVGDIKLNKLIFSKMLSVIFGIYFLALPFIYRKNQWMKTQINQFGVFLPNLLQVSTFIACTVLLLTIISHSRKWEAWEFVFSLTIFWIALHPKNRDSIY